MTAINFTSGVKAFFASSNQSRIKEWIGAEGIASRQAEIAPHHLVIDLTWNCDYRCYACCDAKSIRQNRPDLDMKWEIVEDLFGYAKEKKVFGFILIGGEPLLYSRFNDVMEKAIVNPDLALRLVTNGSLLSDHTSSLIRAFSNRDYSSIRVSVNADEAHYKEFTRSDRRLSAVFNGIEALSKAGISVNISTLVFGKSLKNNNLDQLSSIVEQASYSGARNLTLKPSRKGDKSAIPIDEDEMVFLRQLSGRVGQMEVNLASRYLSSGETECDGYKCFANFFRALVVPSSKGASLLNCTEFRGKHGAEIAGVFDGTTFAQAWHSEDRIKKQVGFPNALCRGIECDRIGINNLMTKLATDQLNSIPCFDQPSGDPFF